MDSPGTQVTAAILVGGQSRRMGQDKARLELDGVALAKRVATLAEQVSARVLICGTREDLADLGHKVIPDLHPGQGPLAGLEAALTAASTEWVLLLACDLPGIDEALLKALMARVPEAADSDAIAVRSERGPEPLIALYRRSILPEVTSRLEQGQRAAHRLLESLEVLWHQVEDPGRVTNLNTPEDLDLWLKADS